MTDAFKVKVDGRTNVVTEEGRFATSVDKVFVAGDMHTGQSLVVESNSPEEDCAREVDAYHGIFKFIIRKHKNTPHVWITPHAVFIL